MPVFAAEQQTENFPCERADQYNRGQESMPAFSINGGWGNKAVPHIETFPTTTASLLLLCISNTPSPEIFSPLGAKL